MVITDVQAGSAAEQAGLSAGMVIVEAGRKPVKTVAELSVALDEKAVGKGVLLLVRTEQGSRFIVLKS